MEPGHRSINVSQLVNRWYEKNGKKFVDQFFIFS
jgi:hypothetical protein